MRKEGYSHKNILASYIHVHFEAMPEGCLRFIEKCSAYKDKKNRMTVYTGYAEAPAACGELIQGQLSPGDDFLLSLPVDLWSKAEVRLTPACAIINAYPGHKTKSVKAVRSLLNHLGLNEWGAHIRIRSNIPEGKGMASSTADIRAVCEAAANALGIELNPHLLSSLAIHIEPSDSTLYAKPVIFNHRQGEALFELNPIPRMDVLLIDTGGTVDTLGL